MPVIVNHKGSFNKTLNFLGKINKNFKKKIMTRLEEYGQIGVNELEIATPKRTGKTAKSWKYSITENEKGITLSWDNTNFNHGVSVVVLIQYGHLTRGGTYVEGIDFINPAMSPLFEEMANDIWLEVTK